MGAGPFCLAAWTKSARSVSATNILPAMRVGRRRPAEISARRLRAEIRPSGRRRTAASSSVKSIKITWSKSTVLAWPCRRRLPISAVVPGGFAIKNPYYLAKLP